MNFAVFGAGCFWCVEALFLQLNGVSEVISGYSGGNTKNPTYEDICTGKTNHAEVCKIIYDPNIISYKQLLEKFWEIHDPTTLNRQGPDTGTQYRSEIFYNDDKQKKISLSIIENLNKKFSSKIVTKISEIKNYTRAEDYHQKYLEKNQL